MYVSLSVAHDNWVQMTQGGFMNQSMWIVRVAMITSVVLANDALSGESPPYAPAGPPVPVYEFCYAFGSAKDGSATTYFTGVFQATLQEGAELQNQFRRFIADKYGSQPDPQAGVQDMTCVVPNPSEEAAAQQTLNNYAANMRRGGGKVVETGWQYVSAPAPAPVAATPVTLPEDPRIASATPEMRGLLEERKGSAGLFCLQENINQAVYDCDCYADRVVIATLAQGATIVQSVDEAHRPVPMLTPQVELVVPRADLHSCVNQSLLPQRAYDWGMQMSGMYVGDAKQRLAQCIADDALAAYNANPGTNIQYFDNLTRNAYAGCTTKVH
jgi:hypothetical protein